MITTFDLTSSCNDQSQQSQEGFNNRLTERNQIQSMNTVKSSNNNQKAVLNQLPAKLPQAQL